MEPLQALQLIVACSALVGTVYNVAKTEFSLRTQTRDVQENLSRELAAIEAELKELISANRHTLELLEQKFQTHENYQEDELQEIHRKIGLAYKNLKIKINDMHGFLKRMGFFDRATLTTKEEHNTEPYLDD